MTEIIDSFRTARPEGRGKAITLFVLTTVGSFARLGLIGFWIWLLMSLQRSFGGSSGADRELRWIVFVGMMVILSGLVNFVGSLLMLRRIKAGLWLYLVSQLFTVGIVTYSVFALSNKLDIGALIFLGFVWVVTGVFVALYLSNMSYYNRRRSVDEAFFESEGTDHTHL